MKTEYIVIEASSTEDLVKAVNAKLADGFKLAGAMSAFYIHRNLNSNGQASYAQALTREVVETATPSPAAAL